MFIGEAPGADEDRDGIPFVGRAGKLLNKILIDIGLERNKVFISNICKCRPPENRRPTYEEWSTCYPILKQEISIIKPTVIITLGSTATEVLLQTDRAISKVRGKTFNLWILSSEPTIVVPTFHPSYALRNPAQAEYIKNDILLAMKQVQEIVEGNVAPWL
jgi:DNA polymerase